MDKPTLPGNKPKPSRIVDITHEMTSKGFGIVGGSHTINIRSLTDGP